MAKESLFNILNNLVDFEGLSVLDLFAGTGNISFEFASRGCKTVMSVDISHKCIRFISQVAVQLNYDFLRAIQADYKPFLQRSNQKWDLIFADPPYSLVEQPLIHNLVFENNLLNPGGWLILEHDKHYDFSEYRGFHDHRKYGKVNFSFFNNPIGG
jgi:16S rRNA (guanine(966)-N(2))-methyltransferase RsmD